MSKPQQQQRRPPPKGQQPPQKVPPKPAKAAAPSFNFLSLFEPAPLSPHPDVDRYLPKVLVGSIVVVTGLMALVELSQGWFAAVEEEVEDATQPAPAQFSRKLVVHEKPIPVESWPRNANGKLIFQPTYDWQGVPQDCVCPAGLEFTIDSQTGRRQGRAIRPKGK